MLETAVATKIIHTAVSDIVWSTSYCAWRWFHILL